MDAALAIGHRGPVPDRRTAIEIAVLVAAATIGLVTWIATMASAPRYSFGAEQDMGSSALYWLLLGAALVGGFLFPRRAGLIGMMLGLPSLLLSPWTAPRGDNDGLWILIIPLLGVFMFVLVAVGAFGAWIRTRVGSTRETTR